MPESNDRSGQEVRGVRHILRFLLKILQDPFGFWLKIEKPSLPSDFGTPGNYINLLSDHRNEVLDAIREGILEKSQMQNETITQTRSLKLNIFLAGGALLGVMLGISQTNQVPFSSLQIFSAWLLLCCIILGPVSLLLDWSFEAKRVSQAQHNEQVAWLLLTKGGHDEEAKKLLNLNVDDLQKIPKWMFWFYFINGIIRSISIIAFIISTILLSSSILLSQSQEKDRLNKNTYDVCIACPK